MLLAVLGVLTGIVTPLQTAVNARLRGTLGTPFRASLVSFTVGLAATTIAALLLGPYPLVPESALQGPWWMWFAGLFGVIFMTGNILLLPKLGSLQTVLMPVLGQITMGLLIDQFGWLDSPRHPMNVARAAGLVLAVLGALMAIAAADAKTLFGGPNPFGSRHGAARTPAMLSADALRPPANGRSTNGTSSPSIWLWRGLGVLCGMSLAVQTAMLGRLGTALGSPIKASVVSFILGFVLLCAVVMLRDHGIDLGTAIRGHNPPWMWIGGLLGAVVVLMTSWLSPQLGTGLTVLVVLIGQVTGGLLVDRFGLFEATRRHVNVLQIVGVAVAVAGIALTRLS